VVLTEEARSVLMVAVACFILLVVGADWAHKKLKEMFK
jgi:hypothetical protein